VKSGARCKCPARAWHEHRENLERSVEYMYKCGVEGESCGGRRAVAELGPLPASEGGALASGVEWWRIGWARKNSSTEPEPG
jgi:hypothetical protein